MRTVEGGPFTADGAVKQGYLFEIPESIRDELHESIVGRSNTTDGAGHETQRMWVVYIGKASGVES